MGGPKTDKDGSDYGSKGYDPRTQVYTEVFRFTLAVILVGGFLAILLINLIGGYADIPTLASIFSAWIVAIIGFYFMDQASDRTQRQAIYVTSKADEKANNMAQTSAERTEEFTKKAKAEIDKLRQEKAKAVKLAEQLDKSLQEALS